MKNIWTEYAKNYGCTISKAIADRDDPMDLATVVSEFKGAAGRMPNADEIIEMHPESESYCNQYFNETYREGLTD